MKKVIWGTGLYASQFIYRMKRENIDFFIDNNKKNSGKYFLGKKILCPDEIENWNNIYIYIPYNYYDEIRYELEKYGFTNEAQFEKYYEINKINVTDFKNNYESALNELKQRAEYMKGYSLFWGRIWALSGRGYKEYIQELKKNDQNLKLGLVSEAVWYTWEETEQIMKLPAIVTPGIFDDSIYVEGGILNEKQLAFLQKKRGFYIVAERLKTKFPDLEEKSIFFMIYYMYQYVNLVLDMLQPKQVILYALTIIPHTILKELCLEREVPLIATHQGILPGTFSFDTSGEIGESLPALYSEEFLKLNVNESDIGNAKKVLKYLKKSKLNRKIQPKNRCIEYVIKKLKKDKPIVFFAGQVDIMSEMVPYTEEVKKYYSPAFKTSIEAGAYIAEICKKNEWNYIYKPHPLYVKYERKECLPDNTIYVEFGDINDLIDISDVVVTIMSQVSYISLIRQKPVVMLGFNQIKGKGCTYEAFKKDKVEKEILEALEHGFTIEQQEAFFLHVAQSLKYYLYDDMMDREIRFGRQIPHSIEDFYALETLLCGKEDI